MGVAGASATGRGARRNERDGECQVCHASEMFACILRCSLLRRARLCANPDFVYARVASEAITSTGPVAAAVTCRDVGRRKQGDAFYWC